MVEQTELRHWCSIGFEVMAHQKGLFPAATRRPFRGLRSTWSSYSSANNTPFLAHVLTMSRDWASVRSGQCRCTTAQGAT
jgi:hypothetical protein